VLKRPARRNGQAKGQPNGQSSWLLTMTLVLSMLMNNAMPILAQSSDTVAAPAQTEASNRVFLPIISSSSNANSKLITGVVYYDYNADGSRQLSAASEQVNDSGIGGVTVTAYDSEGRQCGTTVSSSDEANRGSYSLSHSCASDTVHVEFSNLPAGFEAAPSGTSSKSSTQFVATSAQGVDFGIYQPANFCQSAPQMAVANLHFESKSNTSAITIFPIANLMGKEAQSPEGDAPYEMDQKSLATHEQVGDVYGLAYQPATKSMYAAAFVKYSNKPDGKALPNGAGAIYRIPVAGSLPTLFAVVPDVGAMTGVNGTISRADVGTVGLGDIEVAEDGQSLYALNIGGKKLVQIPLVGIPPVAGTQQAVALPQPADCSVADTHPFGLALHNKNLYVGMVCGGPSNNDLKGYVYEFNGSAFAQKLNFPLNYARATENTLLSPAGNNNHSFVNWSQAPADAANVAELASAAKMAPWLSDIAFDRGDMVLAFRSRWVDQSANASLAIGGELLRACGNDAIAPSEWSLESNGICGGKTTVNPPSASDSWTGGSNALANSKGPGGFEYYWGDDGFEGEAVQGSVAQMPGSSSVFATQVGALGRDHQIGVMSIDNQTGEIRSAGNVGATNSGLNSVGDLQLLCDAPPVELGNRVWSDLNADGIQDANEPGIADLTLQLYKEGGLVASAVTASDGSYYFRSSDSEDSNPGDSIGFVKGGINLQATDEDGNPLYEIRIPNVSGDLRQMALGKDTTSIKSSGGRSMDMVDGTASMNTIVSGNSYTNHTYDFGFVTTLTSQAEYCSADIANAAAMMRKYNLIVLDDLSTTSDVEARTFVGGNFIGANSANFANHLGGVATATESTLVVVGNIVAGNPINLQAGSVRLGGSRNGRAINFNGGGSLIQDSTLSDASMTLQLQAASTGLSTIAPNNSAVLAGSNSNSIRFNVTNVNDCGMAIFNVNAADLFSDSRASQIELNPGSAGTIVINVAGTAVNWSNAANMVGNFTNTTWRGKVLWNFYQATSINLGSHNMMGAFFAPYAAVTTQANMDGSVVALSLTTTSEVHQPEFNGDLSCACVVVVQTERVSFCHIHGLASDPAGYDAKIELPISALNGHFDENGTARAGHEQDFLFSPIPASLLGKNYPIGSLEDCAPPPTPTPTATPTQVSFEACSANLLVNPSFESFNSSTLAPTGWSGGAKTAGKSANMIVPAGVRYGYNHKSYSQPLYQDVAVTPGLSYNVTFYSSSHIPGAQKVKFFYIDSAGNLVGSEQVHTVTKDVDTDGKFGGPYMLTLGAAPNNAAKVRLSVSANGTDWAKIDATCMQASGTPLPTPTNTPVVLPEVEFCSYNLNVTIGQSFNLRDYLHYKNSSAAIDWSKVKFTYTEAGANDPTTPTNWHLTEFNSGVSVVATSADAAAPGNKGTGEFRIYGMRTGQSGYDDHMVIRISNTPSTDVTTAKCSLVNGKVTPTSTATSTPTKTATNTPAATATATATRTATNTPVAPTSTPIATNVSSKVGVITSSILGRTGNRTDRTAPNNVSGSNDVIEWTVAYKPATTGIVSAQIIDVIDNPSQRYIPGSLKVPGGWTTEWSTDGGNTFGSTEPLANTANVAIRASNSNLASNGNGVVSGIAATVNVNTISQANTGGDGLIPIIYGNRVYNVFHHLAAGTKWLMCLDMLTGASCAGVSYPTYVGATSGTAFGSGTNNIQFSTANNHYLDSATGRLYLPASRAPSDGGVLCIDLANSKSCGFTKLATISFYNQNIHTMGGAFYNGRFYVSANTQMMCFDIATQSPCVGQPYSNGLTTIAFKVSEMGGKIITTAYNPAAPQLSCFDPATNARCAGWPTTAVNAVMPTGIGVYGELLPFPMLNTTGIATGVCYSIIDGNAAKDTKIECRSLANGSVVTTPAGLISSMPSAKHMLGHFGWTTLGTKMYLPVNSPAYNTAADYIACFDWATNQPCGAPYPKVLVNSSTNSWPYGIVSDPARPACLWALGDAGYLINFNANDGSSPCNNSTGATLSNVAPANAFCAAGTSAVTGWDKVEVTGVTAGSGFTSAYATLRDKTGAVVTGFNQKALVGNVLDISSIPYSGNNTSLTVDLVVNSPNFGSATPKMLVTWNSGRAVEMCYQTKVESSCSLNTVPNSANLRTNGGNNQTVSASFSYQLAAACSPTATSTPQPTATSTPVPPTATSTPVSSGSIGNRFWYDLDGDGIQDAGEPAVVGGKVKLWVDTNSDNVADTQMLTTTTGTDGSYQFASLLTDKKYIIQFVPPSGRGFTLKDAVGSTESNDSDANSNGYTDMVTLSANQNSAVGAGIAPVVSIGNRFWDDSDGDGIQDAGEPSVSGAKVKLWVDGNNDNVADTQIMTATTNADGSYQFADLDASMRYIVQFVPPTGRGFTLRKAAGSNDSNDSDANLNGYTDGMIVPPSQNAAIGAGLAPIVSIGNRYWDDTNGNGIQNLNEPGMHRFEVRLWADTNNDNTVDTMVMTTTVAADGSYQFLNLNGTLRYAVEFVAPAGRTFTLKDVAGTTELLDSDANANSYSDIVTVALGQNAAIGAGLAPLPAPTATATSTPMPPATATYTPTATATWTATPTNTPIPPTATATATPSPTATNTPIPYGCIGDTVWYDVNSNGIQDGGETGVSGVEITLGRDTNVDGTVDMILQSTQTDSNGYYQFCDILPDFSVYMEIDVPAGKLLTLRNVSGSTEANDSDFDIVSYNVGPIRLTANQVNNDWDAGLVDPPTCTLGDLVWYDTNANGIQDSGEVGVPGMHVKLHPDNACLDTEIGSTTTDSNGNYHFSGLQAGTYCVAVDNIPFSWYVSEKNMSTDTSVDSNANLSSFPTYADWPAVITGTTVITATCEDNTQDMGLYAAGQISKKVWCESTTNPNSTFDAGDGDLELENVTLNLFADTNCDGVADGAAIASGDTDSSGTYTFDNLQVAFEGDAAAQTCYVVAPDTTDPELASCTTSPTPASTAVELSSSQTITDNQYSLEGGFGFLDTTP